jgi:hypothetical protein
MPGEAGSVDRVVGSDLSQRHEHESTLEHARMRYVEPRLMDAPVAEHQNVYVDQARAPALLPHALQPAFRFQAEVQKLPWRETCFEFGGRIQESGWSVLPHGGVR